MARSARPAPAVSYGRFEEAGSQTELVRHERLFPNVSVAPQILMMVELRLNCLPGCAFVHYAYVGRRVR